MSWVNESQVILPKPKSVLRREIEIELKALDSTTRDIEAAILGDQDAIDEIKRCEGIKIELRKKWNEI
jgi:hypothetical protein